MFSCEICEMFKNIFITEHLRWLLLFTHKARMINFPVWWFCLTLRTSCRMIRAFYCATITWNTIFNELLLLLIIQGGKIINDIFLLSLAFRCAHILAWTVWKETNVQLQTSNQKVLSRKLPNNREVVWREYLLFLSKWLEEVCAGIVRYSWAWAIRNPVTG